jgi:hypothetical protein
VADALPVPLPPRGAPAPRLLRLLPAEYQNEPVGSENQIVQPTQIHDFTMEGFIGPDGQPDTYLKGANGVIVKLSECVEYLAIAQAISEKSTADYFALAVMARHTRPDFGGSSTSCATACRSIGS